MASDLIQRTTTMLGELRALGGSDITYIFSPFFKPVDIQLPTIFGAVMNFPSWNDFSEEKVKGFKAIVNNYSDILTGYVRIGDVVYKAEEDHEYKTLPTNQGKELMKALVSRAVKIGKFDLSMLDPKWLGDEIDNTDHTMQEAIGDDLYAESDNAQEAINIAINMLSEMTGHFEYTELQEQEMAEMLQDSIPPYYIEPTQSRDGVQIVGQNSTGIVLYNEGGELYWEF